MGYRLELSAVTFCLGRACLTIGNAKETAIENTWYRRQWVSGYSYV
jgi:hypothetical protein